MATLIPLPALLYTITTVTNNKEINVHETIIETEFHPDHASRQST